MTSVMSPGGVGVPRLTSTPNKPQAQEAETSTEFGSAIEGNLSARSAVSTKSNASTKSEAFVMTGDKMLRLDPKVSAAYAAARKSQLSSLVVVGEESGAAADKTGLGPDLGHRVLSKRLPQGPVQRAHSNDDTAGLAAGPDFDASGCPCQQSQATGDCYCHQASAVTVNPMMNGAEAGNRRASQASVASPSVETRSLPHSVPASPAHRHPPVLRQSASQTENTVPLLEPPVGVVAPTQKAVESGSQTIGGDEEREAAKRLAARLWRLQGFQRADVAAQLSQRTPYGALVGAEYGRLLSLGGMRVDAALREFLCRVPLVGESWERDRLLSHFATAYATANPDLFRSQDEVHTLAAALVLLNTDLHGPNVGKRMTVREFVENFGETEAQVSPDLLKTLYASIKAKALLPPADMAPSLAKLKDKARPPQDRRFLDIPDPADQADYKKGWLMRKTLVEEDGRRTPFGRRGWKMFYATVKGLVLYLHKDERGFQRKGAFATFHNSVRLHHACAQPFVRHSKRQNLFRLRTAGYGELLLQTSSPSEVADWVRAINLVAAQFSSPPLPAPVSSQPSASFQRPLLPSSLSQAPLGEQLRQHSRSREEAVRELRQLKADAPPLHGATNPAIRNYFFRERYLEEDILRYQTYVQALDEQLRKTSQVLGGGGSGETVGEASSTSAGESSSGASERLSYHQAIHSHLDPQGSSYEGLPSDLVLA